LYNLHQLHNNLVYYDKINAICIEDIQYGYIYSNKCIIN